MRTTTKEMREVEVVTISCDLCGGTKGMPRYAQNRRCNVCEREVCGECQGPYSDDDVALDDNTICKICRRLEPEYLPAINETYRTRDRLRAEWKSKSLGADSR